MTLVKINDDKSAVLQLGTWRSRSMPIDCVVGCRTEGQVKLVGLWFDPDLQVDKNWSEVKNRMVSLSQKWA